MKRISKITICLALLFCSAFSFTFSAYAWNGGSGNEGGNTGYSQIQFDSGSKTMSISTGLSVGSTSANRIRSIGWFVTITLPDGQTASAVFEKNGSSGVTGYAWPYDYVISQFAHDAGTAGESIAENFYNSTGGTIKMTAYFAWWKAGSSSDSKYNFNGPADGKPGAVSGYFADPNANYGPGNVAFTKNPDGRFSGAPGINGVATNFDQAAQIDSIWGGNPDTLKDYYPAVGVLAGDGKTNKKGIDGTLLDRVYRVDTDVITPVVVNNNSADDILSCSVSFTVSGVTYQSKSLPVPPGGSNLCWFRWHTPSTPGYVNISATVSGASSAVAGSGNNYIYPCAEQTPPDPQAKDKQPTGYCFVAPGNGGETPFLSWGVWDYNFTWETYTTWSDVIGPDGNPVINPVTGLPEQTPTENKKEIVNWYYTSYSAGLSSALTITPDSHCPTAFRGGDSRWSMKSGYGIAERVQATINTTTPSDVTAVQRTAGFYPEFQYGSYFRLFDNLSNGLFQLKPNKYSMYKNRVHFLPLWWSDNTDYTAQTYQFDAWTPGGMLSAYSTDTVHIKGSCYDDWHVLPR